MNELIIKGSLVEITEKLNQFKECHRGFGENLKKEKILQILENWSRQPRISEPGKELFTEGYQTAVNDILQLIKNKA